MTITTKAALADELGVTRSRVSQYVAEGMPVRSDGKLNRDDALNWIKRLKVGLTGQDKGANRAQKLATRTKPPRPLEPAPDTRLPDTALAFAKVLLAKVGPLAAENAIRAGASVKTAYALDQLIACDLDTIACEFLSGLGLTQFGGRGLSVLELLTRDESTADWDRLADLAGEPFDEDECEDHGNDLSSAMETHTIERATAELALQPEGQQ